MKPDFSKMSRKELKTYVLQHREDDGAIRAYFYHPDAKHTKMPPLYRDGQQIEENIKFAEETIRRLTEKDQQNGQARIDEDETHSE
jgi:hypothetical protein